MRNIYVSAYARRLEFSDSARLDSRLRGNDVLLQFFALRMYR